MTITDKDFAYLCKDSYTNRKTSESEELTLGGVAYRVFDDYNNPITGYQGVAYQRVGTNEVVIANRGTETKAGVVQDGLTDLGMVTTGLNIQISDARAFAIHVIKKVNNQAAAQHSAKPSITLTGHSLGGAITEILAHEFGMQGVTFNAYGAVDLGYHIPEGGTQVTNYVRVTDVVSAASRHFGKVVELATAEDIAQLKQAGYDENVTAQSLRNPLTAVSFAAHSIDNFAPNPGSISDLSPENDARARAHGKAVDLYRTDIQALRANILSLPWQLQQKQETATHLAGIVATAAMQGDLEVAGKVAELAAHRATENARHAWNTATNTATLGINAIDHAGEYVANQIKETTGEASNHLDRLGKALGSEAFERHARYVAQDISQAYDQGRGITRRLLSDATHTGHQLYRQVRDAVHQLDAEHGRRPDQRSDNLAASLTVAAHREGIDQINRVVLSEDASRAFVMGERTRLLLSHFAFVPVVEAINTTVEQSSKAWMQADQGRTEVQSREQAMQPMRQHNQALGR